MVVEDHDGGDHAGSHHEHDTVEVGPWPRMGSGHWIPQPVRNRKQQKTLRRSGLIFFFLKKKHGFLVSRPHNFRQIQNTENAKGKAEMLSSSLQVSMSLVHLDISRGAWNCNDPISTPCPFRRCVSNID